jgi:hypothetical protein
MYVPLRPPEVIKSSSPPAHTHISDIGILLVLLLSSHGLLYAHTVNIPVVSMMSLGHSRSMYFIRIDLFDMGRPLDVVVGISDVIEDQEAEWERHEQEQPRDEVFCQVRGLAGINIAFWMPADARCGDE